MTMSDLSDLLGNGQVSAFARDNRFVVHESRYPPHGEAQDPLAEAFAEGFAQGEAQANAEAEIRAAESEAARQALELSITRFDETMAETLRQRLHDTVAALCEAAIAPLTLDHEALARRVERAVAMLARADDERVIRLNPVDLALISTRLAADWALLEDASLPRGALRIECATGGVEDGPEQWRLAIAEGLRGC